MGSSTMKGLLLAGIIVALATAAVESLSCVQCNSFTDSCDNKNASECPANASNSCVRSLVNSSLGEFNTLYQEQFCSSENCTQMNTFTVHVSDEDRFRFLSQCCQEKDCNDTSASLEPPEGVASNTQCMSCYGPNMTSCIEAPRRCYREERCVSLVAEFKNGNEYEQLVLRGCSNISNATCQFLSAENQTIGGIIFRQVECTDASEIPTSEPTNTTTTTTTNDNTTTTTNDDTTTITITSTTSSAASLTSCALTGLLLLGLLC